MIVGSPTQLDEILEIELLTHNETSICLITFDLLGKGYHLTHLRNEDYMRNEDYIENDLPRVPSGLISIQLRPIAPPKLIQEWSVRRQPEPFWRV